MVEVRKPPREYKVWRSLMGAPTEDDSTEAEVSPLIDQQPGGFYDRDRPLSRPEHAGMYAVRSLGAKRLAWAMTWSVITGFFGLLTSLAFTHRNGWITLVPLALTLWCGRFAVYYAISAYGIFSYRPR